nr:uncharacterized protein LOC127341797 [Lolium perenne]
MSSRPRPLRSITGSALRGARASAGMRVRKRGSRATRRWRRRSPMVTGGPPPASPSGGSGRYSVWARYRKQSKRRRAPGGSAAHHDHGELDGVAGGGRNHRRRAEAGGTGGARVWGGGAWGGEASGSAWGGEAGGGAWGGGGAAPDLGSSGGVNVAVGGLRCRGHRVYLGTVPERQYLSPVLVAPDPPRSSAARGLRTGNAAGSVQVMMVHAGGVGKEDVVEVAGQTKSTRTAKPPTERDKIVIGTSTAPPATPPLQAAMSVLATPIAQNIDPAAAQAELEAQRQKLLSGAADIVKAQQELNLTLQLQETGLEVIT